MNLYTWAFRHGITPLALQELQLELGLDYDENAPASTALTEAGVQSRARLAHNKSGGRCWRNNSGVLPDPDTGRPVRFGLANESKEINAVLKSSDLIGIAPRLITPDMVGTLIGQFWAREAKAPGWRYTGTEREVAQLAFINLVLRLGGDAGFVS
ncbi:MAG: hypothetical protein YHS30scaffold667_57 [Phage 65_10]|nr:MAG: hypothetical protein YHS30scaffold667_57 [Phage 65_10]